MASKMAQEMKTLFPDKLIILVREFVFSYGLIVHGILMG